MGSPEDAPVYRGLVESAPDALIAVDERGRIVIANAQAERLFGYGRGELLGTSVEDLMPATRRKRHPAYRLSFFADPYVRDMAEDLELTGLRRDGTEFPVEISLSPIATPNGTLVASTIRDASERARIGQELRRKNLELEAANRAKDSFLAGMSHELRTPLNAIIGFTGTLLMELPGSLNEEQRRQLEIVRSSAGHLLSLINDILDLAKIESGATRVSSEPIVLQQLVEEVVTSLRSMAEAKQLEIGFAMPAQTIRVESDPRAVRQILINLTGNAIKYTERGSVTVELSRDIDGSAAVRVTDTGIGIAPDDVPNLFAPFQQLDSSTTRRAEGAGLGLYLSRRMAHFLRGEITVRSTVGVGSTFTLNLPAS